MSRMSPRGGKLPPLPLYGERFTCLLGARARAASAAQAQATEAQATQRTVRMSIEVKVDLVPLEDLVQPHPRGAR